MVPEMVHYAPFIGGDRMLEAVRPWLSASAVVLGLLLAAPATSLAADPSKVLRIAFEVAETGFDPAKVTDNYSSQVMRAVYECMLSYDYLARPVKLVAKTAEALPEVTDGGKTYLFKVRRGIYFQPDPA